MPVLAAGLAVMRTSAPTTMRLSARDATTSRRASPAWGTQFPRKSYINCTTGWPFSLCKTYRWLQNKSSARAWRGLAWQSKSGTFVLKSTGGFAQAKCQTPVQISPLTVTLFIVTPRLQLHFWHVPNDWFVTKLPLVTVTIWLQWHFSHVPRVSL